jgi:hypothetical protein
MEFAPFGQDVIPPAAGESIQFFIFNFSFLIFFLKACGGGGCVCFGSKMLFQAWDSISILTTPFPDLLLHFLDCNSIFSLTTPFPGL